MPSTAATRTARTAAMMSSGDSRMLGSEGMVASLGRGASEVGGDRENRPRRGETRGARFGSAHPVEPVGAVRSVVVVGGRPGSPRIARESPVSCPKREPLAEKPLEADPPIEGDASLDQGGFVARDARRHAVSGEI